MYAMALLFVCGLVLVSQAFTQPTDIENIASKPTETVRTSTQVENAASKPTETIRTSTKQSQNAGKRSAPKVVNTAPSPPGTLQTSAVRDVVQPLSDIHIESAADIDKLINEIEEAADEIYNSEMANIQVWSQDQVLAPYQAQAEEGLTIARDRLKESAQKLRTKATEAIETAKATMSPEEFSRYMQELQQVIEVELAPTRQYFMDAAEAITQVSKETAAKATSSSSRGPKSQKKTSSKQNSVSQQVTNVPVSVKA